MKYRGRPAEFREEMWYWKQRAIARSLGRTVRGLRKAITRNGYSFLYRNGYVTSGVLFPKAFLGDLFLRLMRNECRLGVDFFRGIGYDYRRRRYWIKNEKRKRSARNASPPTPPYESKFSVQDFLKDRKSRLSWKLKKAKARLS